MADKGSSKRSEGRRKIVTLKEISKATGYSLSTVSAVLNNASFCYAGKEARDKILKTAEKLGYRPNLLYRGLRTNRTRTIGIVVPNLYVISTLVSIEVLENSLWTRGFHIFMGYSQNRLDKEEALIRDFVSRRVDGIIFIIGYDDGERREEIEYLMNVSYPLVTVDRFKRYDIDFVSMDNYKGGQLAAEHLFGLGHRDVLVIKSGGASVEKRIRGFMDYATRAGMRVILEDLPEENLRKVLREEEVLNWAYRVAKKYMNGEGGQKITAVFPSNDVMGCGVVRAAIESGLKVPDDISVIGFDDSYAVHFSYVPLTTIKQRRDEIMANVCDIILKKIEGDDKKYQVLIEPELVVRKSTGPAKRD